MFSNTLIATIARHTIAGETTAATSDVVEWIKCREMRCARVDFLSSSSSSSSSSSDVLDVTSRKPNHWSSYGRNIEHTF